MTDKLKEAAQQAPMAYYALVIKADSGYESTTEGRCTADQYGAAMAALHGTAALAQQDHRRTGCTSGTDEECVRRDCGAKCPALAQKDATCKQNLQVWVQPSGAFSWEPQDERYWVRMVPNVPSQQDAQAVLQGFDWSKFPGHLIDHYEGEVLTEELLQRAAADLCAAPTPPAQRVPLRGEEIYEVCRRTLPGTTARFSFVPDWAIPLAHALIEAYERKNAQPKTLPAPLEQQGNPYPST